MSKKDIIWPCGKKNLADYSKETWLCSSEMSLAVIQRDEVVEREIDVRNILFFLFTRISPNHPMCQIVYSKEGGGGGGREGWGVESFKRSRELSDNTCLSCFELLKVSRVD